MAIKCHRWGAEGPGGYRSRGVPHWINSVLGTEKSTLLEYAIAHIRPKAVSMDLLFERSESEETVREKSST